jgi:hypothetical protein
LIFRTDHSASFWQDKDYNIFNTGNKWDRNGVSKIDADEFVAINHLVVWNGIGVDYNFTDQIVGTLYLRHLFGQYSASGKTPGGDHEYVYMRDQIHLKAGVSYSFTPSAKLFIEVIVEDTITKRSKDLNSQTLTYFETSIHGRKPEPVETTDNELVVRIPIGITLQIR